jgi:hypothetical protein
VSAIPLSELLPIALGIALSPLPIAAAILMLLSSRAKANGIAFVAGWIVGLLLVGGLVLLFGGAAGTTSQPSKLSLVLQVLIGLALLFIALKQWRISRDTSKEPAMPAWMSTIDDFSAGKAFLVAAMLSGINPKNLALNLAGVLVIAEAGLSARQEWVALVIYVLLASLTVALPVIYYLVARENSKAKLDAMKTWLITNNAIVMAVVLLVLGVKLLAAGAQGLVGA